MAYFRNQLCVRFDTDTENFESHIINQVVELHSSTSLIASFDALRVAKGMSLYNVVSPLCVLYDFDVKRNGRDSPVLSLVQ
jgi:hypothetical protein